MIHLKIGLPKEFFAEGLSAEVGQVIENAITEYKKLGAEIVNISLPNTGLSIPVYYVLAPAEASSNLSRYDGIKFGYRTPSDVNNLQELYCKTRSEG